MKKFNVSSISGTAAGKTVKGARFIGHKAEEMGQDVKEGVPTVKDAAGKGWKNMKDNAKAAYDKAVADKEEEVSDPRMEENIAGRSHDLVGVIETNLVFPAPQQLTEGK